MKPISVSEDAQKWWDRVKVGDDDMVTPKKLALAAELVAAGACTCYAGHDGELYLQDADEEQRTWRLNHSDFSAAWDEDRRYWYVIGSNGICANGLETKREAENYILGYSPSKD